MSLFTKFWWILVSLSMSTVFLSCFAGKNLISEASVFDLDDLIEDINSGKEVILEKGIYDVEGIEKVIINNNIIIKGKESGVVLEGGGIARFYSNRKIDTLILENLTLQNFSRVISLDGNFDVDYVKIKDCIFERCQYGIFINRFVNSVLIENNSFFNIHNKKSKKEHVFALLVGRDDNTENNKQFNQGDIRILDNTFKNIKGYNNHGGEVHAILARGKTVLIENNHLENIEHTQPKLTLGTEGIYVAADSALIQKNKLMNAGGMVGAITLKGIGNHLVDIRDNRIEFDTLTIAPYRAIYGQRANVLVQNNFFANYRRAAISIEKENWNIKNNIFKNNFAGKDIILRGAHNIRIEDNFFTRIRDDKKTNWTSILIANRDKTKCKEIAVFDNVFNLETSNVAGVNLILIQENGFSIENLEINGNSFLNKGNIDNSMIKKVHLKKKANRQKKDYGF